MRTLAAQLPRFLKGHLLARVGHQLLLRRPTAVVLMAGAWAERPDPHGMETGHDHPHTHHAGVHHPHAHHPEADDPHRHHADAHHPHRHDADREDAEGRHPEGDPLGFVPTLTHGSGWSQWEVPEPWASPCLAQAIHMGEGRTHGDPSQ